MQCPAGFTRSLLYMLRVISDKSRIACLDCFAPCGIQTVHKVTHMSTRPNGTVIRRAEEQQAQRVDVTAYASNPDAIKFYERHGFAAKSVTLEAQL